MSERDDNAFMRRARGGLGILALLVASVVVAVALAEGVLHAPLWWPRIVRVLPGNAVSHVRTYYMRFDRVLVQAMPECARYDAGLFYTLRPGACRFRAREFDTRIEANRLGLRDDEASLDRPEIVVLGDSYAMGWGVQQSEAFPARLEALCGRRVLNAGLPSYGTAREMALLARIDRRALRVLVIQYADNDLIENLAYRQAGQRLEIGSPERYERDLQRVAGRHRYFFGKATWRIFSEALFPRTSEQPWLPPDKEARLFLATLVAQLPADIGDAQLVVLELSPLARMNGAFAAAVAREALQPRYPEIVRRLKVLDLRRQLSSEDYFDLDDHLRARGHSTVAHSLWRALRAMNGDTVG